MAGSVTRAPAKAQEVSILAGGPKDRWGYWTRELTAQVERCEDNGIPFYYVPTPRFDSDGRRVWRWTGPDPWPVAISTYDPERAYWHSTHGD